MNRTEFLAALALRLEDLPEDERNEAVKYYSEYLDEVGIDGEDAAIAELGGAEKVGNIIRANCGMGPYRPAPKTAAKPELTLDAPSYAQKVESTVQASAAQTSAAQANGAQASAASRPLTPPVYTTPRGAGGAAATTGANAAAAPVPPARPTAPPAAPPVYTAGSKTADPFAGSAPDARGIYAEASAAGAAAEAAMGGAVPGGYTPPTYTSAPQTQYNQRNMRILWIILLIVLFPMVIGLFGGLIGLIFGVIGGLIGFIFAGFGTFITGIVHAAVSVPLFFTSPATGLATVGLSLLAAGLGALLGGGMLYVSSRVIPWMFRSISRLFGWLRGKVSGRNA